MPDLLAHVFLAYAVCRALSRRFSWLTAPYITVGMVGALLPDLAKANLVVSSWDVRQAIGFPFSWGALHTGGGVLVTVLLGTVLVDVPYRRRVFGLLGVGATTHLLADAMLVTATGRTIAYLWPVSSYVPETPGLYSSTSAIPTVVAGALATIVYLVFGSGRDAPGGEDRG